MLLRDCGDRWELGYYGKITWEREPYEEPDLTDAQPMFRHAQDWQQGNPLDYEPQRFALIDSAEWLEALTED